MEIDYTSAKFVTRHYPQFDYDELDQEYHIDWYDGPLSGVLSHSGNRYYYAIIDDVFEYRQDPNCDICFGKGTYLCDDGVMTEDCPECQVPVRIYGIYKVNAATMYRLDYWQALFHLCVDGDIVKKAPRNVANFLFKFYYARRKKDYQDIDMKNEVQPIGWFKR